MWIFVCVGGIAFGQNVVPEQTIEALKESVSKQYAELETLYKRLHSNPELSFQEKETSRHLASELRELDYDVTENVGGFGVVALMRNGDGPVLMIRADMDALPVSEETGLAYASTATAKDETGAEVPVMHACGHDVHMTCLIGTAREMAARKDAWRGTLMLVLQPAEERGGGAKAMLEDGLFERFPQPNYAIALHVDEGIEAGKIGYISGFAMANVDSVDILVRGVGGHGAYPHLTKDPVVTAAQIVLSLQTIVSREVMPTEAAVITVGSIHGGTKHNIIGNEVRMQLTVRSYSDETRDILLKGIERVAKNTARASGIPEELLPEVSFSDTYTPALYNSPELVERVMKTIGRVVGEGNLVLKEPVMGGEDFGRYGRTDAKIPIFMFRLGTISAERFAESKKPGGAALPSLHSSKYAPEPEPSIKTGVAAMTAAALDLLAH